MKIKQYNINNVDEFVKKVRNNDITYPYRRHWHSDQDIKKMFNNLEKYNVNDRKHSEKYTIRNIDMDSLELVYKGKPLLFLTKESDYKDWNQLSDMFQERCRVRCKLHKQKYSSREFFYKYPDKVAQFCLDKYGKITPYNIRESLWKMVKECTSHRPSNMSGMIQFFNAKKVLDFSSGWGDRLIGAMAEDVELYCGVDPNTCLINGYKNMIDFFGRDKKKFIMIHSKIETAELPEEVFDLIYTSPPYFNFEIYSKEGTQSTQYEEEITWFNNFLKVALDKVWIYLKEGGHMAININQKNRNEKYIKWMLDYVQEYPNSKYEGVISYANKEIKNPQPIWIWKKVFLLETKRLKLRKFRYNDINQMSRIMGSMENMKNIANGRTLTYFETKKKIRQYIRLKYTMYPIILDNNIIGLIGYYEGKYLNYLFEDKNLIRIVIDKNHRRKGYAFEILDGFINYIKSNNITNIYSLILKSNTPSINLHKKLKLNIVDDLEFHNKNYVLFKVY